MIMIFTDPVYQSFTMFTLLIATFAGGLSLFKVASAGKLGIYVGLTSWVLWTIFLRAEGSPLFHIMGWAVTDFGVLKGLSVALRITSVLFAFLIVAMTTPTRDIITGLYGLRVSIVFSMVIGIILRLIPQFQSEHTTIMEAQRSRATEFDKGSLMNRFRKHTSYIIPLTLRALKIVSDLSIAMESRAYDPYTPRTFVRELKMRRADQIILIGMIVLLVSSIILRIYGFGELKIGLLGSGQ
jgi:energy-coupling factor transport system permease protein